MNRIYRKDESILRVLDHCGDRLLVIDCIKRTMPKFIDEKELEGWDEIDEREFLTRLKTCFVPEYEITDAQTKEMFEKYGSISLILGSLTDVEARSSLIDICSNTKGLTKSTIRHRLCDYLAFQDIRVFISSAPKRYKSLTKDEENFRKALNRYYYNALKYSLKETYKRMIRDSYCDMFGNIQPDIPTFRQFQWFYKKTSTIENTIISREGKGRFMRDYRALLGGGVREFCPDIGFAMLDSTICDIFLVDDSGNLIGRPVMTAAVDAYSSMCIGYSLGLEGGMNSLNKLVMNMISDKVEHCRRFGIDINEWEWDAHELPHKLITDKGREYASETFSQLADLGVEIINLPPYRPELKGQVEKFFDLIQSSYKTELASKGVIFSDYQERGAVDYRKKASLTLEQFEKVIIYCILKYNNSRRVNLPYELVGKVAPYASDVWNHRKKQTKNLMAIDREKVRLTLLPRIVGTFKRNGLYVNKLRYRNYDFVEEFIKGGEVIVSYDPHDVNAVYIYTNGKFEKFDLIDKQFIGKSVKEVLEANEKAKELVKWEDRDLKGSIELSNQIMEIANSSFSGKVQTKSVRKHRKETIRKGKKQ